MPVFHYSSVEMLFRDKCSSFLEPFISYAKKLDVMNTHPSQEWKLLKVTDTRAYYDMELIKVTKCLGYRATLTVFHFLHNL